MSDPVKPPAARPCGSCPYRRDVPSGLWHPEEYAKLIEFDRSTTEQPPNIFLCHRQNGRACAGWCAVQDMEESLGLRLAVSMGTIEDPDPFMDYQTDVEVFDSGAEAATHGMADVGAPSPEALAAIAKLEREQDRRDFEDER